MDKIGYPFFGIGLEKILLFHRMVESGTYGKYERSLCNCTLDFISVQSINKKIIIHEFNEQSTEQDPIGASEFFWRRLFYENEMRTHPRLLDSATCRCKQPYNPDMDVMRFCPSPDCQTWYHVQCLTKWQCCFHWAESADNFTTQLLSNSPDKGAEYDKLGLGHPNLTATDASLFTRVREIASQPIARGRGYGIVGNAQLVLAARRWVYHCQDADPGAWEMLIAQQLCSLEQWLDEVDTKGLIVDFDHPWRRAVRKTPGEFVCMKCRCAI